MKESARLACRGKTILLANRTGLQILVLAEEAATRIYAAVVRTRFEAGEDTQPAPGDELAWNIQGLADTVSEVVVGLSREMGAESGSEELENGRIPR
jgi:hypothetical protein